MLVALLDESFVLARYEDAEGDGSPSLYRIPLPGGCDLPIGKYRWDHERQTFMPLSLTPEAEVEKVKPLRAIARGLMAIRDGKPLPKVTLDWLKEYALSMDNKD